MGKIKLKKLNNQGSTFILALLVITLLTTLALALANASLGNMMMKSIDRGSKNTFYTSESLLDEIRAGIGQNSVRSLAEAYESVLAEIVNNSSGSLKVMDNNEANNLLKQRYIENVLNTATGGALAFSGATDNHVSSNDISSLERSNMYTALNSYIGGYIKGYDTDMAKVTSIGVVDAYRELTDGHEWIVIVRDVAVSYKEKKGEEIYFSNITVDLEIEYPNMMVDFTNTNRLTDFTEYAMIADKDIVMTGQSVDVRDSVYAGNRIDIIASADSGSNVKFDPILDGKYINVICGGDSNADSGTIRVGGNADGDMSSAHFQGANIWCTNIATSRKFGDGDTNDATAGAKIFIGNKCTTYVKDDLSVDAQKSEVDVYGKYYGYSYEGASGSLGHASSSAIIVNGRNSKLTIGPNQLYIGGRAYIDIQNSTTDYDDTYQTGEALALKGSQEVYLIPPRFLGVGHSSSVTNPMSSDIWYAITNTAGVEACVIPDGYFAKAYLNPAALPYTIRRTESGMVYVYYNFKNNDAAAAYIKDVAAKVDTEMYDTLTRYNKNLFGQSTIIDVTTDSAQIEASGLFMELNNGVPGYTTETGAGWSPIKIAQTTMDYTNRYKIYTKLLASIPWSDGSSDIVVSDPADVLLNYRGYEVGASWDSDTIINNIVDMEAFTDYGEYNPEGDYSVVYGGSSEKYVKIARKDPLIVEPDITGGIIICKGDVTIQNNFHGLIISGGTIYIKNNAMYTSILTTNSNMVEEFILGKEEFRETVPDDEKPNCAFKEYFYAYRTSGVDEESRQAVKIENVNYKDLVNFDNWRKYED